MILLDGPSCDIDSICGFNESDSMNEERRLWFELLLDTAARSHPDSQWALGLRFRTSTASPWNFLIHNLWQNVQNVTYLNHGKTRQVTIYIVAERIELSVDASPISRNKSQPTLMLPETVSDEANAKRLISAARKLLPPVSLRNRQKTLL